MQNWFLYTELHARERERVSYWKIQFYRSIIIIVITVISSHKEIMTKLAHQEIMTKLAYQEIMTKLTNAPFLVVNGNEPDARVISDVLGAPRVRKLSAGRKEQAQGIA